MFKLLPLQMALCRSEGGEAVLLEIFLEFETRVAKSCRLKDSDTWGKRGGIQVADRLGD
jgi:hypothetical protein